jgi:tetratricopeptide (TPR) repeat protein
VGRAGAGRTGAARPRGRAAGRALAAAVLVAFASALAGARGARADAPPADPWARVAAGDVRGALAALEEAYRKGSCDAWGARLYQDLRIEAGGEKALLAETLAAWPEPRPPLGRYLVARLSPPRERDAALERLLPEAPEPAAVLLDQGWAALAADRTPQATTILDKAKKRAPAREETAVFEARLLEAKADRAAAERGLATFVAGRPEAVDARRAWCDLLVALRRLGDATAVVEEALGRSRPATLLVARAAIAVRTRDAETARKYLDEVGAAGRPAVQAEAHALRSALRLLARDLPGADAAADAGLLACPTSVPALRAKARALELVGRFNAALERLDAALALRPALGAIHVDRGHVLRKQGEVRDARRAFQEARKRDPDEVDAWVGLGLLAEDEQDWAPAEKAYRAAIKADGDHVEARRFLAGVLFTIGKIEQADAEAAWIRDRFPKDPEAWAMAGRVALKRDKFDDALAAFRKSVEADPTYAIGHMGIGWTLEDQGKPEEARKAYEAAVAADPKVALPHRYLAELLEDLEDPKGALEHYRAYLEHGGKDPDGDVRHAIERLSK